MVEPEASMDGEYHAGLLPITRRLDPDERLHAPLPTKSNGREVSDTTDFRALPPPFPQELTSCLIVSLSLVLGGDRAPQAMHRKHGFCIEGGRGANSASPKRGERGCKEAIDQSIHQEIHPLPPAICAKKEKRARMSRPESGV